MTVVNSSIKINQSSSYSNIPFDKSSSFKDARKMAYVSSLQEMENHTPVSFPATSGTFESTSSKSNYPNGEAWFKLSQNVRKEKMEVHNNNDIAGGFVRDKQDKLKNFQDRSANDMLHTLKLDNIAIRGASENLADPEITYDGQFNLLCSSPQQKANIKGQTYGAKNERKVSAINGSSGLASELQGYRMNDCLSINNSNSLEPNNPAEKNGSLTCTAPEVTQPNGLSGNHLLRVETSPGKDEDIGASGTQRDPVVNETYIVNAEQANGIHLRQRLDLIYDDVLVVDNVFVAKEIVGMLTNQFRHLVHACDTEACLIHLEYFILTHICIHYRFIFTA